MKYRRLTQEELQELEGQFVRFLASNTVTADDWVKIKKEDLTKAEKLIEMFSDIVFQQTLEKVGFLQRKSKNEIQIFACLPDKLKLRGLRIQGKSNLDFTQQQDPTTMMQLLQASGAELQIYRAEKPYNKTREQELFEMMEQGCLISKGEMYKVLDDLGKK